MRQGFSKKNQSSVETAYRFGGFSLYPHDRLLRKGGTAVALQPKVFDALLCLVRGAEHLVSKQELSHTLWPDVHVSERNLTNLIGNLRKLLGRDAIRTVSKHGYRFALGVVGEPGVKGETYERFLRARRLTEQRAVDSIQLARDLYWTCLAEHPDFASAWAWLGRCCWFLDKFSEDSPTAAELAEASFQRAFALDPDLACAHQFYTLLEVDKGRAEPAMGRILERLSQHPDEPESFSSLVQVFRFRGLLPESVQAHQRAIERDPATSTSVAHTLFLAGRFESAIGAYRGQTGYYLDAAAWAALEDREEAISLLRERLAGRRLSKLIRALMNSLLAMLRGKTSDAARIMDEADAGREPEILFYFARHYGYIKSFDSSIRAFEKALASGFTCAPETLRQDPWLRGLRKHRKFGALLERSQTLVEAARSSLAQYPAAGSFRS
jgi:DNA-binding winged helix-turn-helix (wHTH) protein/tetratricopeptide (TPR) repeat protein